MLQQGILELGYKNNYNLFDFVVSNCNQASFDILSRVASHNIENNFFCIYGPRYSGKTHLLKGVADCYKLFYLNAENYMRGSPRELVERNGSILFLDNADEIKDDMWWFNIYNLVKEHNKKLVMAARNPPSMWIVQLADWRSRLATFLCAEMLNPDDDTMKRIFKKNWSDKGIMVEDHVLEYLCRRIDRNFSALKYWVDKIDDISAKTGRSININLLHTLFS